MLRLCDVETRGDWIAADELLDLAFGPAAAFFGFDCGDQARAPRNPARSVGCLSVMLAVKVSMGEVL
jgi:hypothetical protein